MHQYGSKYLPIDTPSIPGVGSKVKTFFSESSHVAYQIKENGACIQHMLEHILSLHTPRPLGLGQNYFLNVVMLYIKFKGRKHRPT